MERQRRRKSLTVDIVELWFAKLAFGIVEQRLLYSGQVTVSGLVAVDKPQVMPFVLLVTAHVHDMH